MLKRKYRKKLGLKLSFLRRRIIKPPFPENKDGKTLVHIGCGMVNSPEFINLDARPFPHVHIIQNDLTDLSCFRDGTADLIYMCHILEHIKRRDLENVLSETKRALREGGILRLSVPDFDRIINIYNSSEKDIKAVAAILMGGQEYEWNVHYSVFNQEYLSKLLKKVGFRKIDKWDPLSCKYHDFEDWASKKIIRGDKEYTISLNLEACK